MGKSKLNDHRFSETRNWLNEINVDQEIIHMLVLQAPPNGGWSWNDGSGEEGFPLGLIFFVALVPALAIFRAGWVCLCYY